MLDLVDAVYSPDTSSAAWHEAIVENAVRAFPGAIGALSYCYRLEGGAPVLTSPVHGDAALLGVPDDGHSQFEMTRIHRAYTAPPHAEPTKVFHADPRTGKAPEVLDRMWGKFDCADMFGVYATREGAESMTIGITMPRLVYSSVERRDGEPMRREWTSVARHLASALALRESLAPDATPRAKDRIVAEFDERGRGEFRNGAELHRRALLDLARRSERARDEIADGGGLSVWDQLLRGRWSIVRRVRGNGRLRFIVIENPEADTLRALTDVERAILVRAARGEANKVIAADLGIGISAVANTLARGLRKVGVEHRVQLALVARLLGRTRR